MIKKHLLAGTFLFLLTIAGTSFIASLRPMANGGNLVLSYAGFVPVLPKPIVRIRPFSFANEVVPVSDPRIAWRLDHSLRKHQFRNLQTTVLHSKAERWFPVIEPILATYGIPQDFKYIVLVESGLREGTSHRGASGYWQFMPGTARSYGLLVNRKVDERLDMQKSTVAACKYLRDLHDELRSWTLTAAAYNLGDVKLKNQMASQRQQNYYKMKLNRETSQYVYKLVSMKQIIEHPSEYGYQERESLLASTGGTFSPAPYVSRNPVLELATLQN